MPLNNTPPESPSMLRSDDADDVEFDEQDVLEVVEDDDDDDHLRDEPSDLNDEEEEDEDDTVPERDDAKFMFSKHQDTVLCSAFHPKQNQIVATGGMDDAVYVWDIKTGDVLLSSTIHEDSVEMIGFSYDGKYLATSDLNGNIRIWNTTNNYALSWEFELEDELSWIQWHQGTNVLIGSSQRGLIYMFKISTGERKMVMAPFGQFCNCGKVFPDGKRLACGFTEGHLKILDLKQGTVINSVKFDGNRAISCLDIHRDNNLVICGCDDGDVVLVNSQTGKIASILNSNRVTELCNYVETIAFCKDRTYHVAASGSLDGKLIIWDVAKQILRHRTSFSASVNRMVWHPSQPVLYTCHGDGVVHVYDAKSGTVLRQITGHRRCIYSIAVSPDATYLMTTSGDKTVRIYEMSETRQQN